MENEICLVVTALRNFINGEGNEWDWDDFIGVPLKDPQLDKIRKRCANLDKEFPPNNVGEYCNEDGFKILEDYLRYLTEK